MVATDLSKDIDKLRTDMDELRKDVASIARAIKDLGAAKGQDALARANELGEEARARAAALEERVSREIGERPLASVLTAFGVGFVIGKLLDR